MGHLPHMLSDICRCHGNRGGTVKKHSRHLFESKLIEEGRFGPFAHSRILHNLENKIALVNLFFFLRGGNGGWCERGLCPHTFPILTLSRMTVRNKEIMFGLSFGRSLKKFDKNPTAK